MADMTDGGGLLGKMHERMKEAGHTPTTAPDPEPEFAEDLLITDEDIKTTSYDDGGLLNRMKDEISVLDAYNKWAGKGYVDPNPSRTESVMIRCPNPSHPDTDPSAWVNTEKQTYFCGGCGEGGDIFDIAAWHYGYPVPAYKETRDFGELKERMAQEFGFTIVKTLGGAEYIERIDTPPTPKPEPEVEPEVEGSDDPVGTPAIDRLRSRLGVTEDEEDDDGTPLATVVSLVPRDGDLDEEIVTPSIDWRDILPAGTFMRKWMDVTCHDDLPEEYYFWLGMTSVGLAVGNDMALNDNPPIKGNLFVCLYGPTGIGKSRATNATLGLLRSAFPYDDTFGDGVYLVPSPGSAEALIDAFALTRNEAGEGEDESLVHMPVKGLVRFDELSTLMGRADRAGSAMKPTLMEFFDSYNPVTHRTRGHGLVEAHGHFASCVTTTQPKAIRDLLTQTDADAGFVNRWMFATGVGKTPIAFGRKSIDHESCAPLLVAIAEWAQERKADHMKTYSDGGYWGAIDLEPDALNLWQEFFHDEVVPTKKDGDNSLLSRTDLMMKKIIALLAFDRHHMPARREDVADAIKLWEYLKKSYGMLSREIGVGVFEDCRHMITDIIQAHYARTGVHAAARDILRGIGSRFSSSLVKSVLETLVSLGELREFLPPAEEGERRAPRYAYIE